MVSTSFSRNVFGTRKSKRGRRTVEQTDGQRTKSFVPTGAWNLEVVNQPMHITMTFAAYHALNKLVHGFSFQPQLRRLRFAPYHMEHGYGSREPIYSGVDTRAFQTTCDTLRRYKNRSDRFMSLQPWSPYCKWGTETFSFVTVRRIS